MSGCSTRGPRGNALGHRVDSCRASQPSAVQLAMEGFSSSTVNCKECSVDMQKLLLHSWRRQAA